MGGPNHTHNKCVIYIPNIYYQNHVSDIMIWLLCYVTYESPYWRSLAAKRIQVAWRNRKKRLSQDNTTQNDYQTLRSFIPYISLLSFCRYSTCLHPFMINCIFFHEECCFIFFYNFSTLHSMLHFQLKTFTMICLKNWIKSNSALAKLSCKVRTTHHL